MAVGTIKRAVTLVDGSGFEYSGEVFSCDANAGVGLPVFQQYIVAGLVLLDKLVLYEQGIFFCVHSEVANIAYLAHENLCLVSVYFLMKIRRNPFLEVLCLAYIYNGAVLVIKLIGSW